MIRACALVLCALAACDTSSSANDREKAREEIRKHVENNQSMARSQRFLDSIDSQNRIMWERYTAQFKGKIQPGVGCDACPDICQSIDLRPIGPVRFSTSYRQAAITAYTAEPPASHIANLDLARLACIARAGGQPLRDTLLALLDPNEPELVRFNAASHAISHDLAKQRGLAVLSELAEGDDEGAAHARVTLEDIENGVWPE